jgi:hypothetical protein
MRFCGRRWQLCGVGLLFLAVVFASVCQQNMAQTNLPSPKRDINAVLAAHDKELIAIPGVVGVYVGLLEDGRTACLKVMLARKKPRNGTKDSAFARRLSGRCRGNGRDSAAESVKTV